MSNLEELFENKLGKFWSERADILAWMLNGSIDWNVGCWLRSLSDEEFKEKLEL